MNASRVGQVGRVSQGGNGRILPTRPTSPTRPLMITTQLAVVGGGPGGYAAAFLAADLGLQVVLIDPEDNPGGVCVYRGCIPSKALLHVAKVVAESRHAAAWGVEFGEPTIDLDKLRAFKNSVVGRLTGGTGQLVKHRKVRYMKGTAEIVDAHNLSVTLHDGTNEQVRFDHAILATGSRPVRVPSLAIDSDRVWDSTTALDLPNVPKTLLVVGGGYIGLELGSVYHPRQSGDDRRDDAGSAAGRRPRSRRPARETIRRTVKAVLLNTKVARMTVEPNGIRVTFEGADVTEPEQVFAQRAGCRRPAPQFQRFPVSIEPPSRSMPARLHRRRRAAPHARTVHLRHRRCRRRADARAQGVARRADRRRGHCWRERRVRAPRDSGGRVHRSRGRLVWPGRDQAARENRAVTVAKFPWAASGRAISIDRI